MHRYIQQHGGGWTVEEVESLFVCRLDDRHDDDHDDDGNCYTYDDAHLHIFPPHVLANPVGSTAETLCGHSKVICFVL